MRSESKSRGFSRLPLFFCCFACLILFLDPHSCAFGQRRQPSGSEVRERSGHDSRVKVKDGIGSRFSLPKHERPLLEQISIASEKRKWEKVQLYFANYTGKSIPIYTALMNGALRCRRYSEGALIYEKCRETCDEFDEPTLVSAIRIFGKLGQSAKVNETWDEVTREFKLSHMLVASRIHAAADEGDVETAAAMLDLLDNNKLEINAIVMTSALRSCWGWGPNQHRAAKYLWDLFPKYHVEPDLPAFAALMGAYETAPLQDILAAKAEMDKLEIKPNQVFAESFLGSLLQQDFKPLRGVEAIADALREKPANRVRAARSALEDFQATGVRLTRLCTSIKRALDLIRRQQ